jgi:disulfide bond formation protein DsbB
MSKQYKEEGLFKIIKLTTESIGWIKIALSPIIIGLIVGAIVYFLKQNTTTLVLGIVISLLGLIIGVVWANKHWKGKGTVTFVSRINAMPELEKNPLK